jgi:hypothetical protein
MSDESICKKCGRPIMKLYGDAINVFGGKRWIHAEPKFWRFHDAEPQEATDVE